MTTSTPPSYRTREQLENELDHIRQAPTEEGAVAMIVRRPAPGEREVLAEAELDQEQGLAGDNWQMRGGAQPADPERQVTLINARLLAAVAGERARWPLAGDQLVVDFDLSEENLPAGSRVEVGTAVLQISAIPHTGCRKFSNHYGVDATRFISTDEGNALRLRGANARIIRSGVVQMGDKIRKKGPISD